eukprot:1400359-Amphidinium_carterae.1
MRITIFSAGLADGYDRHAAATVSSRSPETRRRMEAVHAGIPWARCRIEDCRQYRDPDGRRLCGHS